MNSYCLTIRPESAFGTSLKGDTFFGQLCWALANREGVDALSHCLEGYTEGSPFLICSDAFPLGFVPRPSLPIHCFNQEAESDPKQLKKRRWMPIAEIEQCFGDWLTYCRADQEVITEKDPSGNSLVISHLQPHNSIDRLFNTTQGSDFAPFSLPQYWYPVGQPLELWILIATERLSADLLQQLITDIGQIGFGRDASIGLGKFAVVALENKELPSQAGANAKMTLAPSAPQGMGYCAASSFYEPFTRFGRHGDRAVFTGKPFKNPLLLADTGAVFYGDFPKAQYFVGQGLGGRGRLSKALPETVHQGYAPGVGIQLPEKLVNFGQSQGDEK